MYELIFMNQFSLYTGIQFTDKNLFINVGATCKSVETIMSIMQVDNAMHMYHALSRYIPHLKVHT
jgi:hypothetical protein